jgi:hypothetical protein
MYQIETADRVEGTYIVDEKIGRAVGQKFANCLRRTVALTHDAKGGQVFVCLIEPHEDNGVKPYSKPSKRRGRKPGQKKAVKQVADALKFREAFEETPPQKGELTEVKVGHEITTAFIRDAEKTA